MGENAIHRLHARNWLVKISFCTNTGWCFGIVHKQLQAKINTNKASPTKGEQQSKKGPNQHKGNGNSKSKSVTVSQKIVDVNKQTIAKAKQADRTDVPNYEETF